MPIQITYRGHGDSVDQLVWHPSDPDMLATASGDRTVRIWDARLSKAVANVATKASLSLCSDLCRLTYKFGGSALYGVIPRPSLCTTNFKY